MAPVHVAAHSRCPTINQSSTTRDDAVAPSSSLGALNLENGLQQASITLETWKASLGRDSRSIWKAKLAQNDKHPPTPPNTPGPSLPGINSWTLPSFNQLQHELGRICQPTSTSDFTKNTQHLSTWEPSRANPQPILSTVSKPSTTPGTVTSVRQYGEKIQNLQQQYADFTDIGPRKRVVGLNIHIPPHVNAIAEQSQSQPEQTRHSQALVPHPTTPTRTIQDAGKREREKVAAPSRSSTDVALAHPHCPVPRLDTNTSSAAMQNRVHAALAANIMSTIGPRLTAEEKTAIATITTFRIIGREILRRSVDVGGVQNIRVKDYYTERLQMQAVYFWALARNRMSYGSIVVELWLLEATLLWSWVSQYGGV